MLRTFLLIFLLGAQAALLGPLDGEGLPAIHLDRVQVGQVAPDFRLMDHHGTVHQLSQYRGKKHVALVFYRGHW